MTVIDVSEADFQREVVDKSFEVPVVVDFWAEWCGPCRTLGPVLEAEAAARDGKVVLAKLDTDSNQALAQSFQIQGIPAVKAFKDGKVVDEFVGVLPAARVTAFFDGLAPSEADELFAAGDEASLRKAIELDPSHNDARVALAELLHRRGDSAGATALLADAVGSFAADGLAGRIALEDSELDTEGAFELLDGGDPQGAVDALLELFAAGADQRDDLRRVIVAILDRLGVEDPFARDARRRLAAALY